MLNMVREANQRQMLMALGDSRCTSGAWTVKNSGMTACSIRFFKHWRGMGL